MTLDLYSKCKEGILRAVPEEPQVPLDAPPAECFDLACEQTCPCCGGRESVVQRVEDAEVAKCPSCSCEFTPVAESLARYRLRSINENRRRRLYSLALT